MPEEEALKEALKAQGQWMPQAMALIAAPMVRNLPCQSLGGGSRACVSVSSCCGRRFCYCVADGRLTTVLARFPHRLMVARNRSIIVSPFPHVLRIPYVLCVGVVQLSLPTPVFSPTRRDVLIPPRETERVCLVRFFPRLMGVSCALRVVRVCPRVFVVLWVEAYASLPGGYVVTVSTV